MKFSYAVINGPKWLRTNYAQEADWFTFTALRSGETIRTLILDPRTGQDSLDSATAEVLKLAAIVTDPHEKHTPATIQKRRRQIERQITNSLTRGQTTCLAKGEVSA